ncbi:MAG: DUF4251 domain-containing protein [Rikenellaceae bacterium]|nr:DUF4251 domain-containing protein [Rikenellaceae bacterium]
MRYLFLALAVLCGSVAVAQTPESIRRADREQEREVKTAAFVKTMDSVVLSHNFVFRPETYMVQPAGMSRVINNGDFNITVRNNYADIYVPYLQGITPPYSLVILNYTITVLDNYIARQTDDGWVVSFNTNLYSSNTYTFTFTVYSKTGEVNLDISSDFYSTVSYQGGLQPVY